VTLRLVTQTTTISWDGGPGTPVQAGMILDVPPGSALETALGSNITALAGLALANAQTGSESSATSNS
jgi:hypothetical protein